ncbi:RNA polymerase sigma factor [Myxococcota bacterium]
MPTVTDETFLEQLRACQPDAQQLARKRLFPAMLVVCRRMLSDSVLAEQTAEDIWMDFLFRHVDKVQSAGALSAYLRMTTVRRCVRVREFRAKHLDSSTVELSTSPHVHEKIDQQRHMARLDLCLSKLTPRSRAMLRMGYQQELTQEEIGRRFNVSKQYVGRVLKKAIQRLRRCMEAA